MSWTEHDDNCPGCLPVLLDPKTMRALPDDSPEMVAVMVAWGRTTLEERRAWHRVTCRNSRTASDLQVAHRIGMMFREELSRGEDVPR
jgi:hypothetical protein